MRPMNRINPLMPAQAYKTYQIVAPKSSHFRPATCEEVSCPNYVNGWKVHLEGLPVELRETVRKTGRKYSVLQVAQGQTYLVFEAGQACFEASAHLTRIEKPEVYLVKDGDWRGNPRRTTPRKHTSAQDWQEDFAEHTDKIQSQIERG